MRLDPGRSESPAHVLIVGASLAGVRTAQALRARKFRGEITLVGAENEPPYDRPPLSKAFLTDPGAQADFRLLRGEAHELLRANWRLGSRAVSLDVAARTVTLEGGEALDFDALVIATGSHALSFPGPVPARGVHTLRTIADARAIREQLRSDTRVVIIGGGFIGSELAAAVRARGLPTAIVEPEATLMYRALGPVIGATMTQLHRAQGVDVRTGVLAARIEGDERVKEVHLSTGDILAADLVVVGIGSRPSTAWLEQNGLALGNGVICDGTLAAEGVDRIYAAGDVARWHHPRYGESIRNEHWTNAGEHAAIVAANIMGERRICDTLPYVWSDQYGARLQIAGRIRPNDELHVLESDPSTGRFVAVSGSPTKFEGVVARGALHPFLRYRRLLQDDVSWDEAVAALSSHA